MMDGGCWIDGLMTVKVQSFCKDSFVMVCHPEGRLIELLMHKSETLLSSRGTRDLRGLVKSNLLIEKNVTLKMNRITKAQECDSFCHPEGRGISEA
jgi:hypothetical protein